MDLVAPVAGLVSTITIIATLLYINGPFLQKSFNVGKNISVDNNFLDPQGPEVQFVLFKRQNKPYHLTLKDELNFRNSPFNLSSPTKIIIHGFLSSINEEIFIINKNAFLETGDYNVIGMDWSVLCQFEYLSAMRGAQIAGVHLSKMIDWLVELGVSPKDVHLIGHSLGAHVAGMAGNRVKYGKIGRITGLDPALPGFKEMSSAIKLDRNDAGLVDVIHTYMKVLGYVLPLGHLDFYPNGGRFQPGCPNMYDIWKIKQSLECNHARAYQFFAESIQNPYAFKAKECRSIDEAITGNCNKYSGVYMGKESTYRSGIYYFKTREKSPFSWNDY